ncbi:MAG: hypothetical protein HY319_23675 [Armatimonadetes bacterium]|nr:hypothetical protein [Armatimonadota bacterium]
MRILLALVVAGWLAAPASAESLLDAARHIEGNSRALTLSLGQGQRALSWGQEQALQDLDRLSRAAVRLVEALGFETGGVTPQALKPLLTELAVAANRSAMTLQLAGFSESDAALARATLEEARRLQTKMSELGGRFWGLDQPVGPALAAEPLSGRGEPLVYENPGDLLREVRGVRYSAERVGVCRPYLRGLFLGWSAFDEYDYRELRRAAYDFEAAVSGGYNNVVQTRPDYERLRRAFQRIHPSAYSTFEMRDLERAIERLDRFYGGL